MLRWRMLCCLVPRLARAARLTPQPVASSLPPATPTPAWPLSVMGPPATKPSTVSPSWARAAAHWTAGWCAPASPAKPLRWDTSSSVTSPVKNPPPPKQFNIAGKPMSDPGSPPSQTSGSLSPVESQLWRPYLDAERARRYLGHVSLNPSLGPESPMAITRLMICSLCNRPLTPQQASCPRCRRKDRHWTWVLMGVSALVGFGLGVMTALGALS